MSFLPPCSVVVLSLPGYIYPFLPLSLSLPHSGGFFVDLMFVVRYFPLFGDGGGGDEEDGEDERGVGGGGGK